MEAHGYEQWVGRLEDFGKFKWIQYSRELFPPSMPDGLLRAFCQNLPRRLAAWQESLATWDANRRFRNFYGADFCFDELQLGDGWRMYAIFTACRVTLLPATADAGQQARMRELLADRDWTILYGEEREGFCQKETEAFLRLLYWHLGRHRWLCNARVFRMVFGDGMDAVLDDVQLEVAESSKISGTSDGFLIGGAGTGKTLAGLSWLAQHLEERGERLYLAPSRLACEQYGIWQERENGNRRRTGQLPLPPIRRCRFFDFLLEQGSPFLERGMRVLDAEESYAVFREVCRSFPQVRLGQLPGQELPSKLFLAWGEIYGMVKGALFRRNTDAVDPPLSRAQYTALKSFHLGRPGIGDSQLLHGQGLAIVYQLYGRYGEEMARQGFLDGNDLARIVLEHLEEIWDSGRLAPYRLAFLDGCQDLTEVQMQAVMSLLADCPKRLMAVDRFQMLHPTQFHLGFAQQMAERAEDGSGMSSRWYFHRQYRSSLSIARLQGMVMDEIGAFRSLSKEERVPLASADPDMEDIPDPIWVVDTKENRAALEKLAAACPCWHVLHAAGAGEQGISECRGLGEPGGILLWNVFGETAAYAGEQAAWDAFYTGLSRAGRCLLVLEPEQGTVGAFLERMADGELLQKCSSLAAPYEEGQTWQDMLLALAEEMPPGSIRAAADGSEAALGALLQEQYERALELAARYPEQQDCRHIEMICRGKLAEQSGDFWDALDRYIELAQESRIGQDCIAELPDAPDVLPEAAFVALLFFLGDEAFGKYAASSSLQEIYRAYRKRSGKRELWNLLEEAYRRYPELRSRTRAWADIVMEEIGTSLSAMDDVLDRVPAWRKKEEP